MAKSLQLLGYFAPASFRSLRVTLLSREAWGLEADTMDCQTTERAVEEAA